jgi:putative membrane protein insertion efficiency factor
LNKRVTENSGFIMKVFVKLMIVTIRIYQYIISPHTQASCRHIPTCSEYAVEALKVHGIYKGSSLAVRRILRCNPWGTHGFDPVPPKRKQEKLK